MLVIIEQYRPSPDNDLPTGYIRAPREEARNESLFLQHERTKLESGPPTQLYHIRLSLACFFDLVTLSRTRVFHDLAQIGVGGSKVGEK
jgi:hypothetical protein